MSAKQTQQDIKNNPNKYDVQDVPSPEPIEPGQAQAYEAMKPDWLIKMQGN